MSREAELLALLTPHGIEIGRPFGGISNLSALDVAAALAMGGAEGHESALLLTKYCHDAQQSHVLWGYWGPTVINHARRNWKWEKGQMQKLARITLQDAVEAHTCRTCGGTGVGIANSKMIDCKSCGGGGRMYFGDREMARQLGVGRHVYRSTWLERVEWCRRVLGAWEAGGLSALARGL